ncbi:MAG: PAS domain S-box protein [Pseudomonadota bacterium]|nr:PAS domain S-box protein [Pseudomonadota bacterium]
MVPLTPQVDPAPDTRLLSALIVIADHDKQVALEQSLRSAGFVARVAANGADALRSAMEVPDIIVLDHGLPDMNGVEVCSRLKTNAATAVIPVLHISDHPVGDEVFLKNPVDTAELLASVRSLLRERQSQQEFSNFLEAAPDAVVIVDQVGKIVRVNGQTERIFGWRRDELLGQEVEILVPARFRQNHREQRAGFVAHPNTRAMGADLKLRGVRKDGSEFPVEISLSPIRDHAGMHIASIVRDVTDRTRIEAALQDSEVRYRRLFESAKDGILILDGDTLKTLDANPFMTELLGYTHDEFLGKELWEIGFFGDKNASQAAYQELKRKGYIRYDHLPLETKRGEKAEVEFVSNIYQVDGRNVAQCNIRDISERSRLERSLKEKTDALADLHRRKDEFLAMLGHELRNPLAPISNAVHLLGLGTNEEPLQQKARNIIQRQLTQLTHLVDDLMEVSRITTGRVRLRLDRIIVSGVVDRAVESTRPLFKQHRHELTVTLPPKAIWLYADASRLEQVLVNLLSNAAKFTQDGGHIWLTVQEDGSDCVLKVRDTGVGIAPELLPRIFDLFTQAERTLDRSHGGLGIGLALVQRLVEMHHGNVEAHSTLGQGSEFVVRLPMLLAAEPQAPSPQVEMTKPAGPSLQVLVVDDNVDTAGSLAMLLEASGHEVRMAHDGPTALEAALNYHPNVMLLDLGLPGLNGFEVAKRLRQQPVCQNVVLVAMTGYGQEADRQRSFDAGFNHHLVKPADFGKVQEILATVSAKAPKGSPCELA